MLLALMMLFPTAKRLIVDFREQLAAGVLRPVLDPDKFKDLNIDLKRVERHRPGRSQAAMTLETAPWP